MRRKLHGPCAKSALGKPCPAGSQAGDARGKRQSAVRGSQAGRAMCERERHRLRRSIGRCNRKVQGSGTVREERTRKPCPARAPGGPCGARKRQSADLAFGASISGMRQESGSSSIRGPRRPRPSSSPGGARWATATCERERGASIERCNTKAAWFWTVRHERFGKQCPAGKPGVRCNARKRQSADLAHGASISRMQQQGGGSSVCAPGGDLSPSGDPGVPGRGERCARERPDLLRIDIWRCNRRAEVRDGAPRAHSGKLVRRRARRGCDARNPPIR